MINIGIVRDCMDLEYREIAKKMKVEYNIDRIIDDFILVRIKFFQYFLRSVLLLGTISYPEYFVLI